jgi:hypothetical protein
MNWCEGLTVGMLTKSPEKRRKEPGKRPPTCRRYGVPRKLRFLFAPPEAQTVLGVALQRSDCTCNRRYRKRSGCPLQSPDPAPGHRKVPFANIGLGVPSLWCLFASECPEPFYVCRVVPLLEYYFSLFVRVLFMAVNGPGLMIASPRCDKELENPLVRSMAASTDPNVHPSEARETYPIPAFFYCIGVSLL